MSQLIVAAGRVASAVADARLDRVAAAAMSGTMDTDDLENLPPEQKLALLHADKHVAQTLGAFLMLDRRLGRFVSDAKEPILAQMRLAWWRDQLAKPCDQRPTGDRILDQLSAYWLGEEAALIALVDGWEQLLAEPPLPAEAASEFASGRAQCFAAVARLQGFDPVDAAHCGVTWAFGDLAARISDPEERALIRQQASQQCAAKFSLPFQLRALTILGTLARRALARDDGRLVSGRGDVLLIMRLGLLGR